MHGWIESPQPQVFMPCSCVCVDVTWMRSIAVRSETGFHHQSSGVVTRFSCKLTSGVEHVILVTAACALTQQSCESLSSCMVSQCSPQWPGRQDMSRRNLHTPAWHKIRFCATHFEPKQLRWIQGSYVTDKKRHMLRPLIESLDDHVDA